MAHLIFKTPINMVQ